MMRSEYYPIESPWKGTLAIAPRPRGDDWLKDELKAWRTSGFDIIVSLLTQEEERELGIEDEGRLAGEMGLEYHSLPIPDRGVPKSRVAIDTLAGLIRSALQSGRSALIHCRQGIGRSALLAATVLARSGTEPGDLWTTIESARGLPVPETPEQKRWVERHG